MIINILWLDLSMLFSSVQHVSELLMFLRSDPNWHQNRQARWLAHSKCRTEADCVPGLSNGNKLPLLHAILQPALWGYLILHQWITDRNLSSPNWVGIGIWSTFCGPVPLLSPRWPTHLPTTSNNLTPVQKAFSPTPPPCWPPSAGTTMHFGWCARWIQLLSLHQDSWLWRRCKRSLWHIAIVQRALRIKKYTLIFNHSHSR